MEIDRAVINLNYHFTKTKNYITKTYKFVEMEN